MAWGLLLVCPMLGSDGANPSYELDRAPPTLRWLRGFLRHHPAIAASISVCVGVLALLGGWLDAPGSLVPRFPRIPANTAALAILTGLALWLSRHAAIARSRQTVALGCAIVACGLSGLTLVEYVSGADLGIDQLLAQGARLDRPWPSGRPSPQGAAAFLLLGAALIAVLRRRQRAADYLALAAGAISVGTLLGYLFGAPLAYGITSLVPLLGMSIPTALVVLALSSGLISARITSSLLSVVIAADPGGMAARRMLAGLALFPPLAAALIIGSRLGLYALPIASALVLFLALAESSAFIVSTARRLSAADAAARRASDALRASEERVRTLVEQASDAIFVADLEGQYTDVNAAACRLLGYPREELVGKRIFDLVRAADAPRLSRARDSMLAGATHVAEWSLRHRDGAYIPVEVSAKVLPDGRWQASARDITERKRAAAASARAAQAERALRAELEAVARASAAVADAVAELPRADLDSVFRVIAEQARLLTHAEHAAIGVGTDPTRPFERWVTAGPTEHGLAPIGRMPRPIGVLGLTMQARGPIRLDDVREHPAFRGFPPGHPAMASLLEVPIHHRQRLVGSLYLANKRGASTFSDYDEHIVAMLAERAAAAIEAATTYEIESTQRAWLQSTIDQLPEGVILTDRHGELKAVNQAVLAMTGATERPLRLAGAAPFDVRDLDGRPVAFDDLPLVRALRTGEVTRDAERLLGRADGSFLPVSANAAPIRGDDGRITGAVVVVTDVSERKEIERQREEWVAVVAHDLRQPLGTILLSAELLARGTGLDPARDQATVERIRSAAERLNRMVDDLLDAARIAAHQLAIEPRESDLVALARTVAEHARLAGPATEIRVVGPPQLRAWIDPDRVHQVLSNLVSNALKYGAPGGEIVIEIGRADAMHQVTVTNQANQGLEIAPDEIATLFSRFARTRSARQSRTPGIGLGLYICKGLVEAHGGRISATSRAGRTSVQLSIPERPAEQRAPEPCPEPSGSEAS